MNEWTVVTVLAALVALFTAVCIPMIKSIKEKAKADQDNTVAMTELTVTMRSLSEKLTSLESNNTDSHRRLWAHNDEQDKKIHDHDKTLVDHELRIEHIEKREVKE